MFFSVCLSAVFADDSHDNAREKELLLETMLTEKSAEHKRAMYYNNS